MQVNRLSLRLQDELREATNFNTKQTEENLFQNQLQQVQQQNVRQQSFESMDLSDLPVTPTIIGNLLSSFADEIINVFGSDVPAQSPELPPENNPNERVTSSSGTNFVA